MIFDALSQRKSKGPRLTFLAFRPQVKSSYLWSLAAGTVLGVRLWALERLLCGPMCSSAEGADATPLPQGNRIWHSTLRRDLNPENSQLVPTGPSGR